MLEEIIQTTLNSFDFAFCIVINIVTYLAINFVKDFIPKWKLSTWRKRLILLICCLVLGTVYYFIGLDLKLIINSAILAPVAWSWVFRPICEKFNLVYITNDIKDL